MTTAVAATLGYPSHNGIRSAVAAFLGVRADTIDAATPFSAYGLDSLGALELVAHLEDRFGCRLPESLLIDCPDLERLSHALGAQGARAATVPDVPGTRLDLMLGDSRLPDDVQPLQATPPIAPTGRVLLTGATGFLGASLLRVLIDAGHDVVCLVRAGSGDPRARVSHNLRRYGLSRSGDGDRLTVATGDIERPRLGLSSRRYAQLSREVDAVYHAAADVNWVSGYEALRSANVTSTTTLLRFASTGVRKRFHFMSSLSVCFAMAGPDAVDEDRDMLPLVGRLPLGYAQSKCVAESLVRAAAERGLEARVYRLALLAGDSTTGASNADDLVAALLKGCIQMGTAPDLDWTFDAVPVDTAAAAIVRLGGLPDAGCQTFHLRHARPRHWRECVLWLNLFGYRVRLEPYAAWLNRLADDARGPEHALYRLRSFFSRRVDGRTVPEHYEEHARSKVDCAATRGAERTLAIDYPALDATRLDSYLSDLIARGFMAPPPVRPKTDAAYGVERGECVRGHSAPWLERVEPLLQRHFGDPRLRIVTTELVSCGSEHSIISELTSWRRGQATGLARVRFGVERPAGRHTLDVMIKVKPADEDAIEIAETMAAVVDPALARELTAFRDRIGIRGACARELEVYCLQSDRRFRRHMPACYGTWRDETSATSGLLLEYLDDAALIDATDDVSDWSNPHIAAAIDGIAEIHGAWLGRERELAATSWIGHVASRTSMTEMTPLWEALRRHAAPMFAAWGGQSLVEAHAALVAMIPAWWPVLELLPRTLVHNDFNSRNIAIRRTGDGFRLAAYDWELATLGAPQRDLAELLCFTLPSDAAPETVDACVERHRLALERHAGARLPRELWREGFRGALAELLITRLAFYALIHRVRPQRFLPRVLATWSTLFRLAQPGAYP